MYRESFGNRLWRFVSDWSPVILAAALLIALIAIVSIAVVSAIQESAANLTCVVNGYAEAIRGYGGFVCHKMVNGTDIMVPLSQVGQ